MIGSFAVLQGTINKNLSIEIGLARTLLINCGVLFAISVILFYLLPHLPWFSQEKEKIITWQWWYLLPGVLGVGIVYGAPLAIGHYGALKVFIGLIAVQLITSLCWDYFVDDIPLTTAKLVSLAFAFLSGVALLF